MENALTKKLAELRGHRCGLVAFLPVGFPALNASPALFHALERGGADILELGVPFSDPIADGPVIQEASMKSLANGATPGLCFEQISKISSKAPKMILTYYNLLYKRGVDTFVSDAAAAGVSAILAADLPIEEAGDFEKACREHDVATVFLAAPNTSLERFKKIAAHTTGFIYLMAHFGTTGTQDDVQQITLDAIHKFKLASSVPLGIGFGISKKEHVKKLAAAGADLAIVGSAFVKAVSGKKTLLEQEKALELMARELTGL